MIHFNRVPPLYFCNFVLFFILRVFRSLEEVKLVNITGSVQNIVDP